MANVSVPTFWAVLASPPSKPKGIAVARQGPVTRMDATGPMVTAPAGTMAVLVETSR